MPAPRLLGDYDSGGSTLVEDQYASDAGTAGFRARQAVDNSPQLRARVARAIEHAKKGDDRALRFLYVTYANNVYGYIRSIVHDDYEAEDLTQHVFTKMITVIAKYDDRGVPFFAWLLRLARNVAIDHLRARRPVPTEVIFDNDPSTMMSVDLEQAQLVREALDGLSPDQLEVVLLRHVAGLTPGEIADRMGRTESSIHGLHHRGRRAFQEELRKVGATPATTTGRRHHGAVAA
jgi:RNA polymerase sigma-70 factor, ECF subfamily